MAGTSKSASTNPRLKKTIPAPGVPTASELPVTRAMLTELRTELLERIDQSKSELRAEMAELRAEMHGMRGEMAEMRAEMHGMRGEIHGIRADVARIALLVEEQNARNKVVLDALMALVDRQGRLEQRVDKVEETVRALASGRPSG